MRFSCIVAALWLSAGPLLAIPRLRDKFREILHLDRLGEVLVDASVVRGVSRFFAGDASERSNIGRFKVVLALESTDLGCGFETVHDRHVHVHQYQEVTARILHVFVECLQAVFSTVI